MPKTTPILLVLAVLLTNCVGSHQVVPTSGTTATPMSETTATSALETTATPTLEVMTTSTASAIIEEYAVYEAVIESVYSIEGVESIVIKDHTATDLSPDGSLDNTMDYIQETLGTTIELETLNDYRVKNAQTQELNSIFSLNVQCVLLSEAQINEIFETGDGWSQFHATYPNSAGIVTFSRVGFNAEMNQALVYVEDQGEYGAGQGLYLFLIKKESGWSIQSTIVAWVS
jgi:hypothetical protein